MHINYAYMVPTIGAVFLGIVTAILGVFSFFRQQSLLGDAIAHATLPGVTGMFLLTETRDPYLLLLGGVVSGGCGAWAIELIVRYSPLKREAAIGIILSVFFGIGLVCISVIQKKPIAHQALLHAFLVGNASTILMRDVISIMGIGSIALISLWCIYKELLFGTFDRITAQTMGYPVYALDAFFTLLLVAIISLGLPIMGDVLTSILFIAPVAAAWQWTQQMHVLFLFAALIGGGSAGLGVYISSCYVHMPTGPVIVLILCSIVLLSLISAHGKGKMKNFLITYISP